MRTRALPPLAVVALLALVGGGAAQAACTDAAWPLTESAAAIQAVRGPAVPNGSAVSAEKGQAILLQLAPPAEAKLPRAPERAPKEAPGFAGHVTAQAAKAGLYQITLPEPAWIDVIQDSAFVTPAAFTSAHDCPGVRKSVRFPLKAGAFILQFSGASAALLAFTISTAQ